MKPVVEHFLAEVRRLWDNMHAQVTELYANVTQTTSTAESSTSRARKGSTICKTAVVIIVMFLLIVIELSRSDLASKSFTVLPLASTPFLQQSFEGSIIPKRGLVRFPYERLPRRMQPRSFLTPEFLHESNVNTTTIDLSHGEVRVFQPHGIGMHFYMHLGTYRSSPREFSNVGSTPRSLLSFVHPIFKCTWIDTNGTEVGAKDVQVHRPADSFEGAYDALVIICQFEHDVGVERDGGELWITYTADRFRSAERFVAFREPRGVYNATAFEPPFQYDVVFCGSPIFGNVSPQRIREWLAYHAYVFGPRSQIILYDAGGFSPDVMKVVQPWMDLGRVTVENIQQTVLYHGFYYHQRMIVNDCMFKSQFMANWTFFFDVDEYLVVDPIHNLTNFLAEKAAKGIVSFLFDQKRMSASLCPDMHGLHEATRKVVNSILWGFEKYVFNLHWTIDPPAQKYAIQGRYFWATEVHNFKAKKQGESLWLHFDDHIWFHHFHGVVAERGEGCRDFTNTATATWDTPFTYGNDNYSADFTLANLAPEVKRFELESVGELPFIL